MAQTLTKEQVEGKVLEERLAEEQAGSLVAVAILLEALEMQPPATAEEIAAEVVARGLTSDEVMDWLIACEYDPWCFKADMRYQMRLAEKRRAARVAIAAATAAAVAAVGLSVYAFTRP